MEENIDNTNTEESIKDVMHVDEVELATFLTREQIVKIRQELEQKDED
jgi:hypothetical protein